VETIGSKRSYALTWCMPNNGDDDDDDESNRVMFLCNTMCTCMDWTDSNIGVHCCFWIRVYISRHFILNVSKLNCVLSSFSASSRSLHSELTCFYKCVTFDASSLLVSSRLVVRTWSLQVMVFKGLFISFSAGMVYQ